MPVLVWTWPNPFSQSFRATVSPAVTGTATVSLYDLSGKLVCQVTGASASQQVEIQAGDLKAGAYLLRIESRNCNRSIKVLKSN